MKPAQPFEDNLGLGLEKLGRRLAPVQEELARERILRQQQTDSYERESQKAAASFQKEREDYQKKEQEQAASFQKEMEDSQKKRQEEAASFQKEREDYQKKEQEQAASFKKEMEDSQKERQEEAASFQKEREDYQKKEQEQAASFKKEIEDSQKERQEEAASFQKEREDYQKERQEEAASFQKGKDDYEKKREEPDNSHKKVKGEQEAIHKNKRPGLAIKNRDMEDNKKEIGDCKKIIEDYKKEREEQEAVCVSLAQQLAVYKSEAVLGREKEEHLVSQLEMVTRELEQLRIEARQKKATQGKVEEKPTNAAALILDTPSGTGCVGGGIVEIVGGNMDLLRVAQLAQAPKSGSKMDFGEKKIFFQEKIQADVGSPSFRKRTEG